jgi:hypothetical protein
MRQQVKEKRGIYHPKKLTRQNVKLELSLLHGGI